MGVCGHGEIGFGATVAGLAANLRHSPAPVAGAGRAAALAAVPAAAYLAGDWPGLVCGVLIPRLLLYPQLAWMSLLVEHTWFDAEPRTGAPAWVEAGRCLRLYPRNRALALLAAATWLPYGDLHHFAHSAHPGVRWNYLPALERHLGKPHFTPDGLLLGPGSVARRHFARAPGPPLPRVSPTGAAGPVRRGQLSFGFLPTSAVSNSTICAWLRSILASRESKRALTLVKPSRTSRRSAACPSITAAKLPPACTCSASTRSSTATTRRV
ncbi:hypothetical protein AB0O20_37225, partial [Streptomyces kronopolitis]